MVIEGEFEMSKFFRLAFVLSLILASTGVLPVVAGDPPPMPEPSDGGSKVYLPVIFRPYPYQVSGQVTDSGANPLQGVVVTDQNGQMVSTGPDGSYALGAQDGTHSLAAYKEGYLFSPPALDLNVSSNVTNQDFTAVAACNELVANGSFEASGWWSLLDGVVGGYYFYPSTRVTTIAHSGAYSARTGLGDWSANLNSYSAVRTPPIYLPTGTTINLGMWLFPVSSEAVAAPEITPAPGFDQPAFGDTSMAADSQYVQLLDAATDGVLATLLIFRSNNQFWTYHPFNLSAYAGRTVKIQIGTYNDGYDGKTALYADDISLQICSQTPPLPPPPPPNCSNQLSNSGFEYNSNWGIPYTAYPAAYSTDTAYSGSRSMRTGIPLHSWSNVYSYSDAWQTAYIPSSVTSAKLRMRLLPRSEEAPMTAAPETFDSNVVSGAPEVGTLWAEGGQSPEALDAQYVLLLDPNSGAILETLLWWQPKNAAGWQYREFDLARYAGRSIRIQFGAYNNGYGGRTVMYVDDAVLDVCGAPPPPTQCSERITNGSFENNAAWYIPLTAFSAGYSTFLARSGYRSMRTGIYYSYHNRYSYSDVRQVVSIPAGMNTAALSFYAYSMSGEAFAANSPEIRAPTAAELGSEAMAGDVQYLLVLDQWGNWIDTLLWRRANEPTWRYFQFNLARYIGSTIQLQWGSYNNGYSGVTSMYVDDVSLLACP
jgi:hypothetical protein